ncbi:hypothetical protein RI570_19725 [Brucella pseudogrignonensis]|uniref:hypothetical protein n=1 Tax=Brucella pseudogrignonensis TaxID=419475 RepID=UPI0028B797E0|nr:hypothetical protein [Brucella pseudogrignonensis]MDT6942304.1 hypothetical protein [Brucella pseudogrignonensis]
MSALIIFTTIFFAMVLTGCDRTGRTLNGAFAQANANLAEINHNLHVRYGSCQLGYIMTSRGCEVPGLRYNSNGRAFTSDRSGRWYRNPAYD